MNGKSLRFVNRLAESYGLDSPDTIYLEKARGDGRLDIQNPFRYLEIWDKETRTELAGDAVGHYIPTPVFAEMVEYAA